MALLAMLRDERVAQTINAVAEALNVECCVQAGAEHGVRAAASRTCVVADTRGECPRQSTREANGSGYAAVTLSAGPLAGAEATLCICQTYRLPGEACADLHSAVQALAMCVESLCTAGLDEADRRRRLADACSEVDLLHELPRIACMPGDEEASADLILSRASEALPADASVLAVGDAHGTAMRPVAWNGLSVEQVARCCSELAAGLAAETPLDVGVIDVASAVVRLPSGPGGRDWLVGSAGGTGRSQALLAVRAPHGGAPYADRDKRLLTTMVRHAHLGLAKRTCEDELRDSCLSWVRALVTTIDAKDSYTRGHSERVAILARRIGAALGLDDAEQQLLQMAGLVHDLGKIAVNTETLRKASALSESEWDEVRSHPRWSAEIISWLPQLSHLRQAALHHHERYDGLGYPGQLRGEDIPLAARLMAVSDAFDAMTSSRPYRAARTRSEARAEIVASRGTQFCPRTVDAFLSVLEAIHREELS